MCSGRTTRVLWISPKVGFSLNDSRRVEVHFSIAALTESKAWPSNPCPFDRPDDNSSCGIAGPRIAGSFLGAR